MKFNKLWPILSSISVVAVGLRFGVLAAFSSESDSDWQLARTHAPAMLMSQFEAENITEGQQTNVNEMTIREINQSDQSMPLYLINTQTSDNSELHPLCGAAGCLFVGYVRTERKYESVFEFYLDPRLPPGLELFEISGDLQNEMPVIQVNQRKRLDNDDSITATFIFNGSGYVVSEVD